MKRKFAGVALILMSILFLGGIVVIIFALPISKDLVFAEYPSFRMGSDSYMTVLRNTMSNIKALGLVLSLFGGVGLFMSGYAYYKNL